MPQSGTHNSKKKTRSIADVQEEKSKWRRVDPDTKSTYNNRYEQEMINISDTNVDGVVKVC